MSRSLNDNQRLAATAPGSVAIMAGAGTGKTFTLAHRYLHHVVVDGMSPLSIVAATFTDKAAHELRSRIRGLMRRSNVADDLIAEVESAQISTIHSLCQRICRDFAHRIGMSPDFGILDNTYTPAWQQEKLDEAIGKIPQAAIDAIGYNWLVKHLPIMLKDPLGSLQALQLGSQNWSELCESFSRRTIEELQRSDEWLSAMAVLPTIGGAGDDLIEKARSITVTAMNDLAVTGDASAFAEALGSFTRRGGSKSKWREGELDIAKEHLKGIKAKWTDVSELALLRLNEFDETVIAILPHLRTAFEIVWGYFDEEKRNENVLDFNDLERYALALLENAEVAAHYRERWRAILIDEFQDTNTIQAKIIELLSSGTRLTIVGDEKQSIYGFRRADVAVFERFRSKIESSDGGSIVDIDVTFRTHSELVDATNCVFADLLSGRYQPLTSNKDTAKVAGPHLRLIEVGESDVKDDAAKSVIEARQIASEIKRLNADSGIPFSEFAVLSRKWAPLGLIQDALSAEGIPSSNVGGGSLLDTREALDSYSMLGFLAEPNDDIPLVAVLRSPYFAVSDHRLFRLARAKKVGSSWWSAIQYDPSFANEVSKLRELLAMPFVSASAVLKRAESVTGYRAVVGNLPFAERRLADLDGLHDLCLSLAKRGRGDVFSVARYLRDAIRFEVEIPRPNLESADAVNLLTIHRSKGLEWDIVIIPNLGSRNRPDTDQIAIDPEIGVSIQRKSDDHEKQTPSMYTLIKGEKKRRDLDELKRLYYVAVTRAREMVVLSVGDPGDSGSPIAKLRPSLESAGVEPEIIEFDRELAELPSPRPAEPLEMPSVINTEPIPNVPTELPVTALTVFARCPRQFEYQVMSGHPGDTTEGSDAMEIGRIAHFAIQNQMYDVAAIERQFIGASSETVADACRLARVFRDDDVYSSLRGDSIKYEVPFRETFEGITFNGVADLVLDDMVVDHKTDSEADPAEHRLQLWVYANSLNKPRAAISYLRHSILYEYSPDEMADAGEHVREIIESLKAGNFEATPGERVCGRCKFNYICERRFTSI